MHSEHNDSVKSPIWESNLVFKQTLTHVPVQYRRWDSVCENERLTVTVHSIRTICSVGLMSQFVRFASAKFHAATIANRTDQVHDVFIHIRAELFKNSIRPTCKKNEAQLKQNETDPNSKASHAS